MKLKLIARRYSEAFVAYVKEGVGLEKAIEEVLALRSILRNTPELKSILQNPGITVNEKFDFIDSVLKDYFSQELVLFLKLVIEKKRILLLSDMLDYITANYSQGETIEAILKYAHPLAPETIEEIRQKLQVRLGKKLHFSLKADPGILGGVQVIVGNTIIDGSLKGRLDDLKERLITARIN